MERAPLRPVPARPAGPVDPAAAAGELAALLPALTPLESRALALVALAAQSRAKAAGTLGIEEGELGPLLVLGRKELRRTVAPLAGSGWCERAERLISDRLDGVLRHADTARLDVHLRNCPRCVEHERRLVQATDAVVGGLASHVRPSPAGPAATGLGPAPPAPPPPLEAVPPGGDVPEEAAPEKAAPEEAAPEAAPPAEHAPEAAPPEEDASPAAELPAPPAPASPAPPAPGSHEIAAAAEVLVTVRTRRQLAAAVTWNAMIAIALILAIAAVALTVAGILGAEL